MLGKQPAPRENFYRMIYYEVREHTDTRRRTYMLPRLSHVINESSSQIQRAPMGAPNPDKSGAGRPPGYNDRSHEKFKSS